MRPICWLAPELAGREELLNQRKDEIATVRGCEKNGTGTFATADFPGFLPFRLGASPIFSQPLRLALLNAAAALDGERSRRPARRRIDYSTTESSGFACGPNRPRSKGLRPRAHALVATASLMGMYWRFSSPFFLAYLKHEELRRKCVL